jgi:hypothetical protein
VEVVIVYVLEGPADAGNVFGYWKPGLIPAGKFAVVENGELANGGHGPCTVDGKLYGSREAAEEAIRDSVSG